MLLKNVRLSFPHIFIPYSFSDDQSKKYSASFILQKDDPQVEEIKMEMDRVITERLKNKKTKPSNIKNCLRDGAEKMHLDGFSDDVVFFNASNTRRPGVYDRDRSPLTKEDNRLYAGCYVNTAIDYWLQDNQYGMRVNAFLRGLQFNAEGEEFGSGTSFVATADEFAMLEEEDRTKGNDAKTLLRKDVEANDYHCDFLD